MMKLTIEEAAAAMNGREYGKECPDAIAKQMKASGIVAVFGSSDDLMEFRGAIDDEAGSYGGGTVHLNENGLLHSECDDEECPHEKRLKKAARKIKAVFSPTDPDCTWIYKTDIPHATFDIMEDGELYCRGIVFRLADAGSVAIAALTAALAATGDGGVS